MIIYFINSGNNIFTLIAVTTGEGIIVIIHYIVERTDEEIIG